MPKVKHARIAEYIRTGSLKWRNLEVFENSSFPSGVCEVFDAKYTSKKTEARILSAWKFEVYGTQQKSKSWCRSSKAKCRVELTSRFRHGGLRLLRFVLQSTSIYSPSLLWECIALVCACPSVRGAAANVYTVHGHSHRMRSATCICYLCAWVHNFFRIPAYWKQSMFLQTFSFAFRMFILSHGADGSLSRWKVCSSKIDEFASNWPTELERVSSVLPTCRFARTVLCLSLNSKSRVKHETNKMEVRNHAARMFCLHLYLCREIHGPIIVKLTFQWRAVHFDFWSALCHLFRLQKALRVIW